MSGLLFIVAAPSGAGKTTLVRRLIAQTPNLVLSISCTTRPPRPGEVDGRDYQFMDAARFTALREAGDFLEWAKVHGNDYGTSRRWIAAERAAGHDVLLEIDWQGAAQVRNVFPDAIGIFILPPSMEVLTQRLRGRGTDDAEVIERRLLAAREEIRHVCDFGYVIMNADLDTACAQLASVIGAARLTFSCQRQRHPEYFERF
ncbi:MAG: guanylate kinase [Zoogloeaceae bacterium]|jgi:guanylate kinase|nr:guanylate kinase [Zoogloeaceae bacterium]